MAMRSPELILASYSWARRLHMARFTRDRPLSVVRAASMTLRELSLRRPEFFALATGTRRVIRSLSKWMMITCRLWPAISWLSTPRTLPTPWVG